MLFVFVKACQHWKNILLFRAFKEFICFVSEYKQNEKLTSKIIISSHFINISNVPVKGQAVSIDGRYNMVVWYRLETNLIVVTS